MITDIIDPEAYRAVACKQALKLWVNAKIKVNRHTNIKKLLDIASSYTGIRYPNSRKGHVKAIDDLTLWIEESR